MDRKIEQKVPDHIEDIKNLLEEQGSNIVAIVKTGQSTEIMTFIVDGTVKAALFHEGNLVATSVISNPEIIQ